jgi:ferritin-like metal-binding protein YciE
MKPSRLIHLYVEELKELYIAENQMVKALPKTTKAATSGNLPAGIEWQLDQTKEHVARLEEIFNLLEENPNGKTGIRAKSSQEETR